VKGGARCRRRSIRRCRLSPRCRRRSPSDRQSPCLSERQTRSMNTLSIQRPRPSIETRTPALISTSVKAALVNWLPWTPFCLSSGDSRRIDLPATLSDEREDLSGKVTLQGSDGVEFGVPFCYPTSNVVLGSLVGPQASDGDDV
jgi:hypothetical protein